MPLDFGRQYIVLMHLSLALFIRMNMIYSHLLSIFFFILYRSNELNI